MSSNKPMANPSTHYMVFLPFFWVLNSLLTGMGHLFMSQRAKRFFYITSLYAFETQINTDVCENVLIEKVNQLNQRFQLTRCDQRALVLPILTYPYIWRKLKEEDDRNRSYDDIIDHIIQCSPRWIRYEYTQMYDDTVLVLNEFPNRIITSEDFQTTSHHTTRHHAVTT